MQLHQPAARHDRGAEEPATEMPDDADHRQIVYLVLFDRPATGRRLPVRLE